MHLRLFATDTSTNERREITDLYWFEENGVHDFSGDGHAWNTDVILEVFVDDRRIWGNRDPDASWTAWRP